MQGDTGDQGARGERVSRKRNRVISNPFIVINILTSEIPFRFN